MTDWQRWLALEWGILILAVPALLLPSFRPEATLPALISLSEFWVAAPVRRCPWPVTRFNGALLLFAATVGVGVLASAYPDLTLLVVAVPEAPQQGINSNQLGGALSFLLPLPITPVLGGRVTWRSLPLRLLRGGWPGRVYRCASTRLRPRRRTNEACS